MSELRDSIEEEKKNPVFKKAWDEGEIEYRIQRLVIQTRIEANLTQKELSEKTNVAQSNISAIEQGLRVPTFRTLQRIAEGLGKELKIEMV